MTPFLNAALDAVAMACVISRQLQSKRSAVAGITKADQSPVTVADFASQAIIARSLQSHLGALRLIGEEEGAMLRGEGGALLCNDVTTALQTLWPGTTPEEVIAAVDIGRYATLPGGYWTLDPIDGTKGFLRGGQYAISLAYLEKHQVQIAVMGCPNLAADPHAPPDRADAHGVIVYATAGGGSWCVPANIASATPMRLQCVSDMPQILRLCESVESAHSRHDLSARVLANLGCETSTVRLDSQAKYAVVARGQADVYLRVPGKRGYVEKIWDHAAGSLIATEAGAVVTDADGRPLDWSTGGDLAHNRGILCASPHWHARVLNSLRQLQ
ncbi:MAG TPA: 3'(2'),5'-bisphosphate nucleotidase [Gammaproteobacteria bacterium]|nr:3'(2'),5'-bisphosphate nucleotidase [Gammaproteobacteria bacterium]